MKYSPDIACNFCLLCHIEWDVFYWILKQFCKFNSFEVEYALIAHCMSSICAAYFCVFSSCFLKFLAISLDFQLKKHEEILTVHEHECTEECGFCDMDGDEQGIYSRLF